MTAPSTAAIADESSSVLFGRSSSTTSVTSVRHEDASSETAETAKKVDAVIPGEVKEGADPSTSKSKSRNPVKRAWQQYTGLGAHSSISPPSPIRLAKNDNTTASGSKKAAVASEKAATELEKAALKAENSAVKADKSAKKDSAAAWEKVTDALNKVVDAYSTAHTGWTDTFESREIAEASWNDAQETHNKDVADADALLRANPSDKTLVGERKILLEKLKEASAGLEMAKTKKIAAEDKAIAMAAKLTEVITKLDAAKAKEPVDTKVEELESDSDTGSVQGVSRDEVSEESDSDYVGKIADKGRDNALPENSDEESGVGGAKGVERTDKGDQSSKCDWLQTSAMIAVAVGFVFAAFGALCLAGIFPQAFLGGLVGAITVTSASVLLAVAGLTVALHRRNHVQQV